MRNISIRVSWDRRSQSDPDNNPGSATTRVGNSLSDSVELGNRGVIQGPLLFLLYINDVTSVVSSKCKCKLYADDLKLYILKLLLNMTVTSYS